MEAQPVSAQATQKYCSISELPRPDWHTADERREMYLAALAKGTILHTQVHADKPSITPSKYRASTELEDWGYALNPETHYSGNSIEYRTEHKLSVTVDDITYPATFATFFNTIYDKIGTIQADSNTAPHASTEHLYSTGLMLPKLYHWSDVAYLQWLHATRNQTPTPVLRTVIRDHIVNETTEIVFKHLLTRLPPGDYRSGKLFKYEFAAGSPEGIAILGTPNGAGVAYLLIQHREWLGHLVVDNIEVIQGAIGTFGEYLKIVFHIKEAEKAD
jgi:hypothetical protein